MVKWTRRTGIPSTPYEIDIAIKKLELSEWLNYRESTFKGGC
jgi:hypothetical protein